MTLVSKSNRLTERFELSSLGRAISHRLGSSFILVAIVLMAAVPALAEEGDLERGERVYGLCTQCHGANGEGKSEALAPAIAGLPGWYVDCLLYTSDAADE